MQDWYLVCTKSRKERQVQEFLGPRISEVFLPLLKTRISRFGKPVEAIGPLFPGYLFASFEPRLEDRVVRYAPGVRKVLSSYDEPLVVPHEIIMGLKRRCANGPVELPSPPLQTGERVRVTEGPFRGFEAIFERYMSGAERVSVFLSTLEEGQARLVLRSSALERA